MLISSTSDQGENNTRWRKRMNSQNMIKGALLAFCIIGMMVLPAAAAPQKLAANGNMTMIDQGLKDDLWSNHQQYRLQEFDTNVQRANSVIIILNKYSIDTTEMQGTLSTFSSKRSELETALTSRDKENLTTINEELKTLREQFRAEMKESIRAQVTTTRAAGKAGATVLPASGSALASV
jgi:hypothetical protein